MEAIRHYKFVEADKAPQGMYPLIVSSLSSGIELRFDLPDEMRHRRGLRIMCGLIGILCLPLCSALVVVAEFQWPVVLVCFVVVWIAVAGPYVGLMFTYHQHAANNPILIWDQGKRRIELNGQSISLESCQLVLLEGRVDIELHKVQLQLMDMSASSSRVFVLLQQFQKMNKKTVRVLEEFAAATGCQLVRHTVR